MNEERFTSLALSAYRRRLNDIVSELEAAMARAAEGAKPVSLDQPIGRISRMDAIQNQKLAEAAVQRNRLNLAQAKSALLRIETGEFGICLSCGEDIEPTRLEQYPASPCCVRCQGSRERGRF